MRRFLVLTLTLLACGACSRRGPRDVGSLTRESTFRDGPAQARASQPTAATVRVPDAGTKTPREVLRVGARSLGTTATHLFYGSAEDDALYVVQKGQTTPTRLAARAPMPGTITIDGSSVVWIASSGDAVLRVPVTGGATATVASRGVFTDVCASHGEVFFTEAQGQGGLVTRVNGSGTAKLAGFKGTPRGIAVDDDTVVIATATGLLAASRTRGEVTRLAEGNFANPRLDDGWVYAAKGPTIARVKKGGGALETVATNVRAAPIAVRKGVVFWFHADKPALFAGSAVLAEDPSFAQVSALEADDDGLFVATGSGESARIQVVALP